ncbi:MAG: hypothetical protein HOW73_08430 [Polyangiaceae bacterium]|nr:hypothetical protein [Polyangiaceae bacterium]
MPVEVIVVDESLWERANEARRREWRLLILDIPASELWPNRSCSKMVVHFDDADLEIRLHIGGEAPEIITVPRATLQSLLDEYISVIHRLEEDGLHAARAEALDMAKRVVHDDGARKLAAAIPELGKTHDLRRKVFSFVVSLAVDTSKMAGAHRHL